MGLWTTRADQHQAATTQVERAAVQAAVPSQGFQTGPSHEGEELVKGAHAEGGGVLGARTVEANERDVVVDHVTREVPNTLVEHDRAVRGLLRDLGPEAGGEPVPVQGLQQEAPTRPEGLPDAAKGLDVVLVEGQLAHVATNPSAVTPSASASARARSRNTSLRSYPVTPKPRFARGMACRPWPQARSRTRAPASRPRSATMPSTCAAVCSAGKASR